MTYIVNDKCIKCKYQDCIVVCPVDCFYVGENMVVIHPNECIDCGVCEPECPIKAIVPDTRLKPDEVHWVEFNRKWSEEWPNIVHKGVVPDDASDWDDVPDKMKYFSEEPGDPGDD